MRQHRVGIGVVFAVLATVLLTAYTGSGIQESDPGVLTRANTEVAAPMVSDPKSGIQRAPSVEVGTKKERFLKRVLPHIEQENERVARDRAQLVVLAEKLPLSPEDRGYLHSLAKEYRVRAYGADDALIETLLRRVDSLPPSLVLAQAAIESGWGTSRFAREANNLFGQWCFTEGCGIVPASREADATHEVKRFASLQDSVHGYFMNINTHNAYRPLRLIRSCQRGQGMPLTGRVLAEGLGRYSGIGAQYVESVRKVIRVNRWETLDHGQAEATLAQVGEAPCPVGEMATIGGTLVAAGE